MSKNKKNKSEVPLFVGSHITDLSKNSYHKPVDRPTTPVTPKSNLFWKNFSSFFRSYLIRYSPFLLFIFFLAIVAYCVIFHFEMNPFSSIFFAIPVMIVVGIELLIAKWIYQKTIPFALVDELTEKDNPAVGIHLAGFLLGMALILLGGLLGTEKSYIVALLNVLLAMVIGIPLMGIAAWVQNRFLLYKFSIIKEIQTDHNIGTGAICCGSFIATGMIIQSSFLGESNSWLSLILSILGAYTVGQVIFIVGSWFFTKAVGYDFHLEIGEKDNISAGIVLGSFLVSLGLAVSASITNINLELEPFSKIAGRLGYAAAVGLLSIVLLLGMGLLTAKAIFSNINLDEEIRQKNSAVAVILGAVYIIIGGMIRFFL